MSFSYARSNFNSDSNANTDVNTYQLNIYGSHNIDNYYIEGLAGGAYNNYSAERHIAGVGVTARSDFDGGQFLGKIGGGHHYSLDHGFDLTPNASVTYVYTGIGSANEHGAGALDLNNDNQNFSVLEPRIGVNTGYTVNTDVAKVRPEVHASVGYDVIGDKAVNTSTFTGAGTTFKTDGASVAKASYDLGAGIDLISKKDVTLSANYDYERRTDYNQHTGTLKLKYQF